MSQRIHLDATPGLFHQVLHCHQGDVGRQFEIAVVTRDGYEIPSGATFKIQATKPSGLGFTVTGTAANNIISFTSTEDMTSEAGEIPTQLEIKSGNDVIYTSNFLLVCETNVHPSSVTDGSPEEIISEITLLVERAESAASTAGADAAAAAQARVDEMMNYLPTEVTNLKSDLKESNSSHEVQYEDFYSIPISKEQGIEAPVFGKTYSANVLYGIQVCDVTVSADMAISTAYDWALVEEDVAIFSVEEEISEAIKFFKPTQPFNGLRMYTKTAMAGIVRIFPVATNDLVSHNFAKNKINSRKYIKANELSWSQADYEGARNDWQASTEKLPIRNNASILFKMPATNVLGAAVLLFSSSGTLIETITITGLAEYLLDESYIKENDITSFTVTAYYNVAPAGAFMFPVSVASESEFKIIYDPQWYDFGVVVDNSSLGFEDGNILDGQNEDGTLTNIRTHSVYAIRGNKIKVSAGLYNIFVALYSSDTFDSYIGYLPSVPPGMAKTFDLSELGFSSAKTFRICMWQTQNANIPVSYGASDKWSIKFCNYIASDCENFANPVIDTDRADATVWDGGDGWYYTWSTGSIDPSDSGARTIYKSTNLVDWVDTGVFPFDADTVQAILAYAHRKYDQNMTAFYAPTVIKKDGKYILYVSLQWYATISAISESPTGPFIWNGKSIVDGDSGLGVTYEDSFVAKEVNGAYYFFFGSHGSIYRAEMKDNAMELIDNPVFTRVAGSISGEESTVGNRGEGVMLYRNDGYWYMFFSKGNYNTYQTPPPYHVLIGRAKKITDTFVDKTGTPLTDSDGGTTILSTDGNTTLWGAGHNAEIVAGANNREYMFYSRWDETIKGRTLWLQEIKWGDDGWPYFENNGHPTINGNIRPFANVIPVIA